MARKKRRFEQLEAAAAAPQEKKIYVNPLQKHVDEQLEDVSKKLEGKGRTILYGVGAVVVLVILVMLFMKWSARSGGAAQTALGKAIETSAASISETGTPAGSTQKTFKTEKERSEAAITEFQAVADKFGGSVGDKARYFIAVNRLTLDRPAAVTELEGMSSGSSDTAKLAKFALAQTRTADNRLDDAAQLYQELTAMSDSVVSKDTLNYALALVYEKQGKKAEAAQIYFDIAKAASEAKDMDGKPVRLTETATNAKNKIKDLDPVKAKEIPDPTPDSPFGGG